LLQNQLMHRKYLLDIIGLQKYAFRDTISLKTFQNLTKSQHVKSGSDTWFKSSYRSTVCNYIRVYIKETLLRDVYLPVPWLEN
jgi:hypothetical protein